MTPDHCQWKEDSDGVLDTACGNAFQFDEGFEVQRYRFCPKCGRLIEFIAYQKEEEE